jgi:hypothetical protein
MGYSQSNYLIITTWQCSEEFEKKCLMSLGDQRRLGMSMNSIPYQHFCLPWRRTRIFRFKFLFFYLLNKQLFFRVDNWFLLEELTTDTSMWRRCSKKIMTYSKKTYYCFTATTSWMCIIIGLKATFKQSFVVLRTRRTMKATSMPRHRDLIDSRLSFASDEKTVNY